jgi:hypothetical protein
MRTAKRITQFPQFTPAERDLIRQFLSRKADKKDVKRFDETFYAIEKVKTLRKKQDEGLSKGDRSSRRKRIRFYQNKIAQAAKQAAIERNKDLVPFLFRYLRRYGFPKNTSHLLCRMGKKGRLDVKNAEGEVRTLNHRTVRLMIDDMKRPFSWPKPGHRRKATTQRQSVGQHRHKPGRVQPSLPKLKFLEGTPEVGAGSAGTPHGSARGRWRPER